MSAGGGDTGTDGFQPWIVVGPVPPVLHGVAFMTPHVLEGMRRAGALAAHLDTSDNRPAYTTNRLDVLNVYFALKHMLMMCVLLVRHRDARVVIPISQGRWGFLRDAVLVAVSRLARRRVTLHLNGGLFAQFYREAPGWERRLIRTVLANVDRVWVLTDAHRGMFEGLIDDERVDVLENTSEDVGGRVAGMVVEERSADEGLRLLFLSNLFPEKGCFDLIEALERLGGDAAGVHLRLVGEAAPEVAEEVGRRAPPLAEVGVRVEYAGTRTGDGKAAEYAWADAFTLPSRYPPEGQPLVLLEAMSAGLPIIASDHSGIPLTVRADREGLIVPPGDIDAIGEAIVRMRDDEELRTTLGANSRRRYEEAYTNESFYRALAALAGPEASR
jgi:glycosyltransferase involved in cell wall biosynthesis